MLAQRSRYASNHTAYSLLETARNPANWRRQADARTSFRKAIVAADLPCRLRVWADWLADRFTTNGDLVLDGGIGALVARSPTSRATTFRYLAELERFGLVEREGTTRRVGQRKYVRFAYLRIAAGIRQPPPTCESLTCGDTRGKSSSVVRGSVGDLTTDRRPRDFDPGPYENPVTPAERRAVDDDWWRLYRARSDVPDLRPGYSLAENLTYQRLERERANPPGEFVPEPGSLLAAVWDMPEGTY